VRKRLHILEPVRARRKEMSKHQKQSAYSVKRGAEKGLSKEMKKHEAKESKKHEAKETKKQETAEHKKYSRKK